MKTQFSALVAAGLLLLSGCKKDADLLECSLPAKPTKSLANFTAEYSAPPQTFSFNATQPQTLNTQQKATIRVPANAFQLPSGAPASGTIELRVREIYAPSEMLLANMPTMAWGGDYLESGGEFQVTAWQGNTRLVLRPGRFVQLATPVPNVNLTSPNANTPMSLWTRRDSSGTGTWLRDTARVSTTQPTPQQQLYSFSLWRDSLSWCNVDRLLRTSGGAQATVTINAGSQTSNTRVYLLCRSRNALLTPNLINGEWALYGMPVGLDVVAVVLQLRGDQLYYGAQRTIIGPNLHLAPTLEALDPDEIARRVRQF
jgi:hypothetical protein